MKNPLFEYWSNISYDSPIRKFYNHLGYYGSIPFSDKLATNLYSRACAIIKQAGDGYGSCDKCKSAAAHNIYQLKEQFQMYDEEDYRVKEFFEKMIQFWDKFADACGSFRYHSLYELVCGNA